MTVAELIELLKKEPQDAVVCVETPCYSSFQPADSVHLDRRGMVVIYGEDDLA